MHQILEHGLDFVKTSLQVTDLNANGSSSLLEKGGQNKPCTTKNTHMAFQPSSVLLHIDYLKRMVESCRTSLKILRSPR